MYKHYQINLKKLKLKNYLETDKTKVDFIRSHKIVGKSSNNYLSSLIETTYLRENLSIF